MVLIGLQRNLLPFGFAMKFPSPCGDYGSYLPQWEVTPTNFTPLFPSPCGDYGSYLLEALEEAQIREIQFPSPCGDYGSYRPQIEANKKYQEANVSVPLRGLWFLSASDRS